VGSHGSQQFNQAQEAHSNSLSGWDFMMACQPFKSNAGGAQQLTNWMGFHGNMSAIQIELGGTQ